MFVQTNWRVCKHMKMISKAIANIYMKHTLNHMEHVRDCMEACFANHCHMCRAGAAVGGGVD